MADVKAFARKHRVNLDCTPAPRPLNDDWGPGARHFKCRVRGPGGMMVVSYHQGPALTEAPNVGDVLDSLKLDAGYAEDSDSWETMARETGVRESDWIDDPMLRRKLQRSYDAVVREANDLKRILGDEAYHELLYETESL